MKNRTLFRNTHPFPCPPPLEGSGGGRGYSRSRRGRLACIGILLFSIGMFLLVIGLWLIAVPENKIKEAIENSLNTEALNMEIIGLKKGLFYNLSADRLILRGKDSDIIYIEDFSGKINPLYLFLLRIKSSFDGKVYDGIVSGTLDAGKDKKSMNAVFDNVRIENISYLKSLGFNGKGTLNAKLIMENNHANVKFNVNDARLETLTFSGINIPLDMFNKAQGQISMDSSVITINSSSLEGTGIYGRVKGTVKDNIADLTLEIMPDASAQEKFLMLALIERYKVSPGYYVIPVKTRLPF